MFSPTTIQSDTILPEIANCNCTLGSPIAKHPPFLDGQLPLYPRQILDRQWQSILKLDRQLQYSLKIDGQLKLSRCTYKPQSYIAEKGVTPYEHSMCLYGRFGSHVTCVHYLIAPSPQVSCSTFARCVLHTTPNPNP